MSDRSPADAALAWARAAAAEARPQGPAEAPAPRQATPEQLLTLEARAIYFDTQPLVESNWPDGSSRLKQLCKMARGRGLPMFVPEPVLQELEQQFVESIEEGRKTVRAAEKSIRRLTGSQPELPDLDEQPLLRNYRERVRETLASLHIETIPVTKAAAAEMFEHAVRRGKPFHVAGCAKDAGFKDAVVLRSICDHVRGGGFERVMFVSADGDHENARAFDAAVERLAKRTLGQALDAYRNGLFSVEAVTGYTERIKLIGKSANNDLPTITAFVLSELQNPTSRTDQFAGVADVRGAAPLAVDALDLFPSLADVQVGQSVDVTLVGVFELRVSVQRPEPDTIPSTASARDQLIAMLAARTTEVEDTLRVLVLVEAVAERTADGYRHFQPRSARVANRHTLDDETTKRFSRRILGEQ